MLKYSTQKFNKKWINLSGSFPTQIRNIFYCIHILDYKDYREKFDFNSIIFVNIV